MAVLNALLALYFGARVKSMTLNPVENCYNVEYDGDPPDQQAANDWYNEIVNVVRNVCISRFEVEVDAVQTYISCRPKAATVYH